MRLGDFPGWLTKHSVVFTDLTFPFISYPLVDLGKGAIYMEWAKTTDAWQTRKEISVNDMIALPVSVLVKLG